jgi:putative transposase/transposase-like zinc-binding protein
MNTKENDVGSIFRRYMSQYRKEYSLSYEQRQAARAIMECRTPALGGVIKACSECGSWEFQYKSCKNRHCPKCGAFEKAQWLESQKIWVLPIHYFHVVFTIDHVFNPLVWWNQEVLYNHLIETAAKVLKDYGRKELGGELGCTLVLHTWGQTIQTHPHVHFMVTGGALVHTPEADRWQAAKQNYLFNVEALSRDFRHRFCEGVRALWQAGTLNTQQSALDVADMLLQAEGKNWEVYIQAPLYGVEKLLEYLGRYIFRIALSNHRILAVEHDHVTFSYYDNREDRHAERKPKQMTLPVLEFMRRFLLHVLPDRFVRIRHYGLHHGSCRAKLQQARRLLGLPPALPVVLQLKLVDWLKKILQTDQDPRLCQACQQGLLLPVRQVGPISEGRARFLSLLSVFVRWKTVAA